MLLYRQKLQGSGILVLRDLASILYHEPGDLYGHRANFTVRDWLGS